MNVKEKLQALLTASNDTTGETDTTLTDAVQSLIDGFGGGGQAFEYDIIEYTVTTDSSYGGTLYTIPHGLDYTPSWFVAVQVPHSAIVNGRALYWTSVGGESGMIANNSTSQFSFWVGYSRESDVDKRVYADSSNFYVRSKEWAYNSVTSGSTIYVITKNMGV